MINFNSEATIGMSPFSLLIFYVGLLSFFLLFISGTGEIMEEATSFGTELLLAWVIEECG